MNFCDLLLVDAERSSILLKINYAPLESRISTPKAPPTTIHDKARIVHMLANPSLSIKWSQAYAVLDRNELDDKDGRDIHKKALADVFNNYSDYRYSHACKIDSFAEKICADINPSKYQLPLERMLWTWCSRCNRHGTRD